MEVIVDALKQRQDVNTMYSLKLIFTIGLKLINSNHLNEINYDAELK